MSGTVPWYISNTAPTIPLTVASRLLLGHPNWICFRRFWIPCLSGRSPRRAAGGALLLLLLLLFFILFFLKVSKVYLFLKFFNFLPLYLLPELRNPHMLPDSPGLPWPL